MFLQDTLGVTLGSVLGHSLCTGLAVLGGRMIAQKISVKTGNLVTRLGRNLRILNKFFFCFYSDTGRRSSFLDICYFSTFLRSGIVRGFAGARLTIQSNSMCNFIIKLI